MAETLCEAVFVDVQTPIRMIVIHALQSLVCTQSIHVCVYLCIIPVFLVLIIETNPVATPNTPPGPISV